MLTYASLEIVASNLAPITRSHDPLIPIACIFIIKPIFAVDEVKKKASGDKGSEATTKELHGFCLVPSTILIKGCFVLFVGMIMLAVLSIPVKL